MIISIEADIGNCNYVVKTALNKLGMGVDKAPPINIILSGEGLKVIHLRSGTRQGCLP